MHLQCYFTVMIAPWASLAGLTDHLKRTATSYRYLVKRGVAIATSLSRKSEETFPQ